MAGMDDFKIIEWEPPYYATAWPPLTAEEVQATRDVSILPALKLLGIAPAPAALEE